MLCEACLRERAIYDHNKKINVATQLHHKYPKTKPNLKIYGAKLIHHPVNLMYTCADCNVGHKGIGLIHWTEEEFCKAHAIEPKSKNWQNRKLRENALQKK